MKGATLMLHATAVMVPWERLPPRLPTTRRDEGYLAGYEGGVARR